ncbi:hypothetical protein EJB05_12283, partial [Eragrostis curvula]
MWKKIGKKMTKHVILDFHGEEVRRLDGRGSRREELNRWSSQARGTVIQLVAAAAGLPAPLRALNGVSDVLATAWSPHQRRPLRGRGGARLGPNGPGAGEGLLRLPRAQRRLVRRRAS